ncbi:MAG: NAD-dependent epimerase/dehydratase family protein [Planctomycetaceae bacterium]
MPSTAFQLPPVIDTDDQLEQVLTQPSDELVESITRLQSPLVILGAGGKMGPTMAVLAKRAAEIAGHRLEVVAASRFRDSAARQWLEQRNVTTRVSDVFDRAQLAELPDSANVMYLVGMKFGTATDPVPTWITNTLGPILTAQRYPRTRIVALSTGNVYPLSDAASQGSGESDPLTPLGEYANAAVARERIFQHFSVDQSSASPTTLVRLNYAHDLRYGVVSDIANKIARGEPVSLEMGYFNAIWQGDANEVILRCFNLCRSPALALNVTSPEIHSVRGTARRLGQLLGRDPVLVGEEQPTALLSNAHPMVRHFGPPRVSFDRLLAWVAHWTKIGGATLNKPTHFESRDGRF